MSLLNRLLRWFAPSLEKSEKFERVPYRVFTREFDCVVDAKNLGEVLGPMDHYNADLEDAWSVYSNGLVAWRMRTEVSALEASDRIRSVVTQADLDDTTVSILIDQSGSMRGQSMILAAASADIASSFLIHLGPTVEVLGFTTSSWNGGKSRKKWERSDRPRQPGRLCDLLHIVYRPVDDRRAGTLSQQLKPMLRPDLPKENVDGEAIVWAASRLRARPEKRKLLLVISDGAPVDDSTLLRNHSHILTDHVIEVIRELEAADDVNIAAIGIGYDVNRYYGQSSTIHSLQDLGVALLTQLEQLLCSEVEVRR